MKPNEEVEEGREKREERESAACEGAEWWCLWQ